MITKEGIQGQDSHLEEFKEQGGIGKQVLEMEEIIIILNFLWKSKINKEETQLLQEGQDDKKIIISRTIQGEDFQNGEDEESSRR